MSPAYWWCHEDTCGMMTDISGQESLPCVYHIWGRKDAQKSDSEWKLWAAHFTGPNKLSFYSFIMCQHFVVCWVSFRELKTSDWNSEIIHERKILKRDYFHKRESLNQNLISGNLNILSSYTDRSWKRFLLILASSPLSPLQSSKIGIC